MLSTDREDRPNVARTANYICVPSETKSSKGRSCSNNSANLIGDFLERLPHGNFVKGVLSSRHSDVGAKVTCGGRKCRATP